MFGCFITLLAAIKDTHTEIPPSQVRLESEREADEDEDLWIEPLVKTVVNSYVFVSRARDQPMDGFNMF